jgi:hypothetical protein
MPCGQKEQNNTHKPDTRWDHIRAPAYTPISGIDVKGITPELLQNRLSFTCCHTWWFFFVTITIFLSLFLLLSLYPPFPVLQSIILPPNRSFCPFTSTLSSCLHLLFLSFPNCHQTTPSSYTLTTHWLSYLMNCTQPQPHAYPDTSTLHCNNRSIPEHTQRPKTQQPLTSFLPTPHFSTLVLVSPLLIT